MIFKQRERVMVSEKYERECKESPVGQHLQGTYYGISGQVGFIYTRTKDRYKRREGFCQFPYCPFCGTALTKANTNINDKGRE
jgi:hypothetical protein